MNDNYIIFRGKLIHEGDGLYLGVTDAFFRGAVPYVKGTQSNL